ncbi:MAG: type IX secretion system sortase PorU, partial [Bacteroidales bacterium]|nr:type IX secretion system sortase PorU [Bacteroidales bacterium]
AFTGSLKSYVLFLEKNTLKPVIMTPALANQDLHSSEPAEMIIVTHPLFRNYADRIAQVHYGNSGLTSQVVTPDEIYNEFSGGIRDLVAIRNFLRMKYLKQAGTDHPLKYLLLLGDGSYENRTLPPLNPNFIPTYQSQNSNIVVSSFTSDDFFGLLEDGEGEAEGTEDIGIGRLPVSDTAQAGIMLRKISRYLGSSNTGDWKNNICIIADDEDGNTHINDAEGLSKILEDSVPSMNIKKIYLDAFRQVTTVNGQSYPDVTAAINEQVSSGALIINYVGHGSENGLAHERVVKTEDIKSWSNFHRLPLFITATCEFSRFDDMDINIITKEMTGRPSAGEMVLLSATGGGIALMSTTRVVYSAPNYYLNRNIFDFAFDRDTLGEALRLGDIMRLAKNNSGSGTNKRNFSLLGDPALRLAYPWHGNVVTDSVNHVLVSEGTDTLKALSRVTISGHIENMRGETLNDFTGTVSPIVFDKTKTIKTLANDGGQPYSFKLRNNILFSGKTTAAGGKFRFSFIVPRDIDYSYGPGKISYYASNNGQDLNGYFNDIIVGGFAQVSESDKSGPKISLYMNDTLFRNGGITDKDPKILAIIEDKGGINTTGTGIGHDLVAYLDNDNNNSFVLNNYFENDIDNYMKGKVVYGLSDLTGGQHSVTLKAWDNFNNSSVETIHFVVETDGRFILKDLLNYPNPVQNETKITAGHNRPEKLMDITITIYDLSGRAVRIIRTTEITSGYQLSPIIWDGKSEEGSRVGKGIYIYRISVVTPDGEKASASGRIIIL